MVKVLHKIILIASICLMIFLCGSFTFISNAAETEFEIEQVYAKMPDITIYLRGDESLAKEDLSIWMNGDELQIDSLTSFFELQLPTDYFVLVDVSNSISNKFCEAVKEALQYFSDSILPADRFILITFGEDVSVLLEGDESEEERENMISLIHNSDNATMLFEAMQRVADISDRLQDDHRKIILVISDGEDFSVGASTCEEVKSALSTRNIPVYAMGTKGSSKENLNIFGETARELGGTFVVFDATETMDVLEEFLLFWRNTWVIEAKASNNKVNYQMNDLLLQRISTGITRQQKVLLNAYYEDDIVPKIDEVKKIDETTLEVCFSERVLNGENSSAWKVSFQDENLFIISSSYVDDTHQRIQLSFEKGLYEGTYTIAAPGITDDSMEKNPVKDNVEIFLEGRMPEEEMAEKEKHTWRDWIWLIPVLAIVVFLLVIFIAWQKIKKKRGIVYVNGRATLLSNVDEHLQIDIHREEGMTIFFDVLESRNNRITATLRGSMIVGRSSICDLTINDNKLSKQHFALERKEDVILISDLNSTNGTRVNGSAINKNYKLNAGDIISAGDLRLRISW